MGKGRNWTNEEYIQLSEEWGMYSIPAIAKHLDRSVNAILIKAQHLKLGSHIGSSDMITLNSLIKELGLSYSNDSRKFIDAGLKIHKQRVNNCSFKMVDIDEFWLFAEANKQLIDFSRLDEFALGKEPDWARAKRTQDYYRTLSVKPHNAKWSESEDNELRRLLKMFCYSYPEISKKLCRSEGAIQRRINDLGLKERPAKADNHNLWTDEQFITVGDMIRAGCGYECISKAIGKSTKAIRGKVYTVYLTEKLPAVAKLIGNGRWGDGRPERTINQKLLMTVSEKETLKNGMSKLVCLLTYQIRKHFDEQDNWQRFLCRNWNDARGCQAGETNCDSCNSFQRIQAQHCVRCGATFYERAENRICERCRIQRKKAGYRKYLRMNGAHKGTDGDTE